MVAVQQAGDLTLDHETREVSRAGQIIHLTPTEFALLEYLMQNTDRVVSRTMLEEQVWGYHHDPETNLVDVYIRRLRNKIDPDHQHPLIQTIRGVGYKLMVS
jgi:DNA-binding response OmpR family regulator